MVIEFVITCWVGGWVGGWVVVVVVVVRFNNCSDSPLNSMTKLHVVSKYCKPPMSRVHWILASLFDGVKFGVHLAATFTHRTLKGDASNNTAWPVVWLKKKDLLNHLLHKIVQDIFIFSHLAG